jgi:hypothetical protein
MDTGHALKTNCNVDFVLFGFMFKFQSVPTYCFHGFSSSFVFQMQDQECRNFCRSIHSILMLLDLCLDNKMQVDSY